MLLCILITIFTTPTWFDDFIELYCRQLFRNKKTELTKWKAFRTINYKIQAEIEIQNNMHKVKQFILVLLFRLLLCIDVTVIISRVFQEYMKLYLEIDLIMTIYLVKRNTMHKLICRVKESFIFKIIKRNNIEV